MVENGRLILEDTGERKELPFSSCVLPINCSHIWLFTKLCRNLYKLVSRGKSKYVKMYPAIQLKLVFASLIRSMQNFLVSNANPGMKTSRFNIKLFLTLIILLKTDNQGTSSLIVGAFVCELWNGILLQIRQVSF